MSTGNKYVDAMGEIAFEGNIIPMEWFKHVRLKDGKPDTVAIILLSEIVYWYRPAIDRDERSGEIVRYRKRFKADLLQKSYRDLASSFGLTVREAEKAITRLEQDYGLIQRDCRKSVKTDHGLLGNVLFIKPIVANIRAITHPHTPLLPVEVLAPTHQGMTYTENTTETTFGFPSIVPPEEEVNAASQPGVGYQGRDEIGETEEALLFTPTNLPTEAMGEKTMVSKGRDIVREAEGDNYLPQPLLTSPSEDGMPRKRTRNINQEAQKVLAYLNTVTNKEFKVVGQIRPRLVAGATVEECMLVIDYLHATWSPEFQQKRLDHSSPFWRDNFDKNLQAAKEWYGKRKPKTPVSTPLPRQVAPDDLDLTSLINTSIPQRSPHAPR